MQTLLVAVDFSEGTAAIVRTAAVMARAFDSHVFLLHVVAPDPEFVGYEVGPQSVRDGIADHFRQQHRELQALERGEWHDSDKISSLLVQGPTVEKILDEQRRLAADAIVMGSHGHGALYELLVGSVTEGVLRAATCPVVVVPTRTVAVGEVGPSESQVNPRVRS